MSWWWLGATLVGIIAIPILQILFRVISARIRLEHYKKQGVPIHFYPALGNNALFNREQPENATKSNMGLPKKLASKATDGAFAVNTFSEPTATLFIHSSDMVREFLLHEDHFIKAPIVERLKNELGLFFQNGEKAVRSKALFTKIFAYDGLDTFAPIICEVIKESFTKFDQKHSITTEEYKKISLEDLFDPIMAKIANVVVFGETNVSETHPIALLHRSLKELFGTLRLLRSCIPFLLSPTLAPKLGLVPPLNKVDKITKRQQDLIAEILKLRQADPRPLGQNIIDRVLHHNKECEASGDQESKMSLMDIVGNFNLFLFAGTDTSQNTTKMAICHMADKTAIQQIVRSINSQIYAQGSHKTTNQVLEDCKQLHLWTREALRIHSPIARSSLRIATQDTTLKGIKIRKGDRVSVLGVGLNFDGSVFKNPEEFQLERFSPEKDKLYPRYQAVPFLVGKRVCLGRHLGELMVKLLVTQFVLHYDFQKPSDHEYYLMSSLTINVTNPQVMVKRK